VTRLVTYNNLYKKTAEPFWEAIGTRVARLRCVAIIPDRLVVALPTLRPSFHLDHRQDIHPHIRRQVRRLPPTRLLMFSHKSYGVGEQR
jgi:hypothetical protein